MDNLAGAFVQEAQRRVVLAPFELGIGVALGLRLVHSEVFAGLVSFCLNDTDRLAVDEQQIIGRARICGVFAHRDTAGGAKVDRLYFLNVPACVPQFSVDLFPRASFRRHWQSSPHHRAWFRSLSSLAWKQAKGLGAHG